LSESRDASFLIQIQAGPVLMAIVGKFRGAKSATTVRGVTHSEFARNHAQEPRRTLSATALRGFFNIARKWRLDDNQMRGLLGGITPSKLHARKRSPDKRVLGQDTITRVSLVVGIYKALHIYFGDPGDYWITHPNDGPCSEEPFPLTT